MARQFEIKFPPISRETTQLRLIIKMPKDANKLRPFGDPLRNNDTPSGDKDHVVVFDEILPRDQPNFKVSLDVDTYGYVELHHLNAEGKVFATYHKDVNSNEASAVAVDDIGPIAIGPDDPKLIKAVEIIKAGGIDPKHSVDKLDKISTDPEIIKGDVINSDSYKDQVRPPVTKEESMPEPKGASDPKPPVTPAKEPPTKIDAAKAVHSHETASKPASAVKTSEVKK